MYDTLFFEIVNTMVKPTKKLLEFLTQFENQSVLSELTGIDQAVISRLINEKQSATISLIESIYKFNHWPLGEAWEVVDD